MHQKLTAVTLRYRPVTPIETSFNGSLQSNYMQTRVLSGSSSQQPKKLQYKFSSSPLSSSLPIKHSLKIEQENNSTHRFKKEIDIVNTSSPMSSQDLNNSSFDSYIDDSLDLNAITEENLISLSNTSLRELVESPESTTSSNLSQKSLTEKGFKVGDHITLIADYDNDNSTFTIGTIAHLFGDNAAINLIAQRNPYLNDSPLFSHPGGMTIVVPQQGIKIWDADEEILKCSPEQYMQKIREKSIKKRKKLDNLEESPKKKQVINNIQTREYCPSGVEELDLTPETREKFYSKWSKADVIVIGCLFTKGISNFRKLLWIREGKRTLSYSEKKDCKIIGFSFYIVKDDSRDLYFLNIENLHSSKRSQAMQLIAPIFECNSIPKICVDLQFILESLFEVLWEIDEINKCEDPFISSWILDPTRKLSMNSLLNELLQLGEQNEEFNSLDDVEINSIGIFYSDMQHCLPLHQILANSLNEDEQLYYTNIEIPSSIILARMHMKPLFLDTNLLNEYNTTLQEYLELLKSKSKSIVNDSSFNIASQKEVSNMLFTILKLPTNETSKQYPSTSSQVLTPLISQHPLPSIILDFRSIRLLLNTHITPLLNQISKNTKITCDWNGRSSNGKIHSSKPNLQSLPRESLNIINPKDNKQIEINIRKCFKAQEEHQLISFDCCQLEIRIIAHLSKDEQLISLFQNSKYDIHILIASKLLNKQESKITKKERFIGKSIIYGIIYGQGIQNIAQKLELSKIQTVTYINRFKNIFKGILRFKEQAENFCRENGYITTITGRKKYLKELKNLVLHSIISGSSSDIIKKIMVSSFTSITDRFPPLGAQLVFHINDEIIFECTNNEIDILTQLITQCIQQIISFDTIPLKISHRIGPSLGMMM